MDSFFVAQALNVAYEVVTLAVIVLGLAIVFGFLGVMNLAHGEFVALGAYVTYVCQSHGLPYLVAVSATIAACTLLAPPVERFLIRPLYDRPFDTLLATWGLSLFMRKGIEIAFGGEYKSLKLPIAESVPVLGTSFLVLMLLCATLIAVLLIWHRRSSAGARVKAMVGNRELAQAVGIRTDRLARNTFVVGLCFAGRRRDGRSARVGAALQGARLCPESARCSGRLSGRCRGAGRRSSRCRRRLRFSRAPPPLWRSKACRPARVKYASSTVCRSR